MYKLIMYKWVAFYNEAKTLSKRANEWSQLGLKCFFRWAIMCMVKKLAGGVEEKLTNRHCALV